MRWLTDPYWLWLFPWALGLVKKGGGGAAQQNQADALSTIQAEIAQNLYQQTDPNRQAALNLTGGALTGGYDSPYLTQGFAPIRDQYEGGFQAARENLLQTNPARGGQLNKALMLQDLQRARDLAALQAQFRLPLIEAGINTAFGAPSTSLQGLGSAAQTALGSANYGLAQQAQNVRQTQQLGQGIGKLASMAFL